VVYSKQLTLATKVFDGLFFWTKYLPKIATANWDATQKLMAQIDQLNGYITTSKAIGVDDSRGTQA